MADEAASGRIAGCVRYSRNRISSKNAPRLLRGNRVIQIAAEDIKPRPEGMVEADKLFAVIEDVLCVQHVIAEILVGAAMEVVRARARHEIYFAARTASLFGKIV